MAKEYNITRTSGRCAACDKEMVPQEEFAAAVLEAPADAEEDFLRRDYCMACWPEAEKDLAGRDDVFGTWRSRVPKPKEKKRTFVDDELLVNFFQRLDGADEPAKISFRFVLALVLMRKKLLVYERSRPGEGDSEIWTMHFKGDDATCEVIDPHLDEDRIAEVSEQLGAILEGEL